MQTVSKLRVIDGLAPLIGRVALLNDRSFASPLTDRTTVDGWHLLYLIQHWCAADNVAQISLVIAQRCRLSAQIRLMPSSTDCAVRSVNGSTNEQSFNSAARSTDCANPSVPRNIYTTVHAASSNLMTQSKPRKTPLGWLDSPWSTVSYAERLIVNQYMSKLAKHFGTNTC